MERVHVSVSKKSLFPLAAVLCGLVLCVGMVQRLKDPVYPSTMDDYLYLISGISMALIGLFGMRRFPWMCMIPVVIYIFVGFLTPTIVHYYQMIMIIPLFLLLIARYPQWVVWMLKGLGIIAVCMPFAMAFLSLQDELSSLEMSGYLTDAVQHTKWSHFLLIEASFYVGVICMIMALRWIPEKTASQTSETVMETEYDETDEILDEQEQDLFIKEESIPVQQADPNSFFAPNQQYDTMPEKPMSGSQEKPIERRGGGYPYNRNISL